jgi:hypothetical protein
MTVQAVEGTLLVSETLNVSSPTVQEKPDTSQLSSVVIPHGAAAAISGAPKNDVVISAAANA